MHPPVSTSAPVLPAPAPRGLPPADCAHVDRDEADLLHEIQRIQKKLAHIRQQQSRRRGHGPKLHSQTSSQSARRFANDVSPASRIVSVSLRLPRNDHRTSARQQLFDAAIPPKAALSLPDAVPFPFIWVGSDPPGMSPDSDDVVLIPTSMHLHQRHLRRRRRRQARDESNNNNFKSGNASTSTSGAQRIQHGHNDDDDKDDEDDLWEDAHPYHPVHQNVRVDLPEDPVLFQRFQSFCEDVLWRLLHYDYIAVDNPDLMVYWLAYREINQRFAESVAEVCEDGDIIWVHNYHLMLLPALLRDLVPHARIGFFLYTPFPSSELFRILPYRMEILRGVVAADVIGFHSYDHAKQFVTSARRHLRLETTPNQIIDPISGRKTKVGIYPSGIDADTLRSHVSSRLVKSRVTELRMRFEGVKVVVGVDRLDDCFAGLLHKLLAFELMLSENPELVGKVVLVQAAMLPKQARSPSTYREQQVQLNECVARVNSYYGTWSYSPIHFINSPLDPTELHALMCVGHVLLVSTVRDGMALVPHEWTVCQYGRYNGPIVLSEFSSAAHSFSTALHVNPWDVYEVAAKIKVALDMGDVSRQIRNEAAYRFVTTHTAQQWGTNFLEDVNSVKRPAFADFYRRRQQHQRLKQTQQKHQQGQQQQSNHQQIPSTGSATASNLSFPVASPTTLKPTLDVDALIHAYLGTTNSNPRPPLPPPPPPSLSLSSSPPFAYGDHISRIIRESPRSSLPASSPLPFSRTVVADTAAGIISSANNNSGTENHDKSGRSQPRVIPSPSRRSFNSAATETNNKMQQLAMQSSSSILGNGPMVSTGSRRIDEILASSSGPSPSPCVGVSEMTTIINNAAVAKRVRACLFIVDIEGTLIPSRKEKRGDIPPNAIDIVQALVDASSYNFVLVTSSHGRQALLRAFGDMRVFISAEDGAFFRAPGSSSWSLLFRDSAMSGNPSAGKRHSPGNTTHDGDQYSNSSAGTLTKSTSSAADGDTAPTGADGCTATRTRVPSADLERLCDAVNEKIGKRQEQEPLDFSTKAYGGEPKSNGDDDNGVGTNGTGQASSENGGHVNSNTNNGTNTTSSPTAVATTTSKASMSSHTSFSSVELGQGDSSISLSWKECVMQVLQHFAERTPGVVVHEGEAMVTWEYSDVEADHGHWQARQVQKHLESFMLRGVSIGMVCEEGMAGFKWIRIRPADVDKSKAVLRFFKAVGASCSWLQDEVVPAKLRGEKRDKDVKKTVRLHPDLIACFGDDRADEATFELLQNRSKLEGVGVVCSPRAIFTCKVGKQVRRTAAAASLGSPEDVVQLLKTICEKQVWPQY